MQLRKQSKSQGWAEQENTVPKATHETPNNTRNLAKGTLLEV